MKTRLLIIIGVITILAVSVTYVSLAYNQEIKLATGMMISDEEPQPVNEDVKDHLWCAKKFDQTKHEFNESLEGNTCDNPICPESEPPLFSSALHSDEEFIEKECAKFIDKWAYMTEDNDYTWHSIYWESFVKHHYESDPLSDPQRNEKCAELFDLIMLSSKDSDLWYEITETNDFRDAKCASIVEEWEHLTEHDVWNIGISWDDIAVDAERK